MSIPVVAIIVGFISVCVAWASLANVSFTRVIFSAILYKGSNYFARSARKYVQRSKLDSTLASFAQEAVRYITIGVVIFTIADALGFGITWSSISTFIASFGIAIGLASQKVLSNIAAGFMILVLHPFKVGDTVRVCGVQGVVTEVLLFDTCLLTPANVLIRIPNAEIFGKNIENLSANPLRRVEVDLYVPPAACVVETRRALEEVVQGPLLLKELADKKDQLAAELESAANMFESRKKVTGIVRALDSDRDGQVSLTEVLKAVGNFVMAMMPGVDGKAAEAAVAQCSHNSSVSNTSSAANFREGDWSVSDLDVWQPPTVQLREMTHLTTIWQVRMWVPTSEFEFYTFKIMDECARAVNVLRGGPKRPTTAA